MPRRLVSKQDVQRIVQLRDQEKRTWFQIAACLGWSPMAVWQHYHRVRPYDKTRPWARKRDIEPGDRSGRLTVVSIFYKKETPRSGPRKREFCVCVCDCGKKKTVRAHGIKDKKTRSCGCLTIEINRTKPPKRTHGGSETPEYGIWCGMRRRCSLNPDLPQYPYYGGRGIRVAERWLGKYGFKNFMEDIGPRPSIEHSLDRIDPDGHYEPGNVRWGTQMMQAWNKRRTLDYIFSQSRDT